MNHRTFLTTSWDDGHPLDLRLAGMLDRYGLPGTFYVPRSSDRPTMTPTQVREIGGAFEVGAHTLTHKTLTRATDTDARREIAGSKAWVEDLTGEPCLTFCPPEGRYARRHLGLIREAGFKGVRTVEMVSLDAPRRASGLQIMPTTVQAHPHTRLCFARNLAKRGALRNFVLYARLGRADGWVEMARALLEVARARAGVFHVWGHSWEIDEAGQWGRLDELFRLLSAHQDQLTAVTNAGLCEATRVVPVA